MSRPDVAPVVIVGRALLICLSALLVRTPARGDDEPPPTSRWEEAIRAFEAQDAEHPPAPDEILFVGSSSIRFWELERDFPDLKTLNRGFGGSQIADSVEFAERFVLPRRPSLIVLYAGDNDIASGKSPCQVHEDFLAFVGKVHAALPETRIVFLGIKPSPARWTRIHRIRAANALIDASCVENELLTFVTVEAAMLGADGQPQPELYRDDKLHLTRAGYEVWAKLLRPHLPAPVPPAATETATEAR